MLGILVRSPEQHRLPQDGGEMSILFVLLTFLVVISINYICFRPQAAPLSPDRPVRAPVAPPVITNEQGFSIPQGYCFHPGHTWVMRESKEDVRVGLDTFAAEMVGKIDRIDVVAPNRWVRQGQRLMTVHADGVSFDLVSPVEGVVTAINDAALKEPKLAVTAPYQEGWIATLKSPDFATNKKNLMQSSIVAPWLRYCQTRLVSTLANLNPALAQDGGVPVSGVLLRVPAEMRQKLISDFFLN